MKNSFFAGSYGGDASKLTNGTKLECKVCWYVYDPAEGDEHWQIPPGTPFSVLPDHWNCPACGGLKEDFLVIEEA
jgi:rubredoxin